MTTDPFFSVLVTAYNRVRESARQTQKLADTLSESIVDRFPARFLPTPASTPAA